MTFLTLRSEAIPGARFPQHGATRSGWPLSGRTRADRARPESSAAAPHRLAPSLRSSSHQKTRFCGLSHRGCYPYSASAPSVAAAGLALGERAAAGPAALAPAKAGSAGYEQSTGCRPSSRQEQGLAGRCTSQRKRSRRAYRRRNRLCGFIAQSWINVRIPQGRSCRMPSKS